jgi:hypothetical protein
MALKQWMRSLQTRLFSKAAQHTVQEAADAALDDLETALLGKTGAADHILADPDAHDPLHAIRQQHNVSVDSDSADEVPAENAVEKAQAELARLKESHRKEQQE